MSDKFSLYQTDGLWGIIENASNEKQTSIKSYFGSDLIIKRLNEQAEQIDQLKQQNEELMLQLSKYEIEKHKPAYCTLAGTECEYLGNVHELKQQLAEKDKEIAHLKEKDNYHLRYELAGADETITNLKHQLAEKDKEIAHLKDFIGCKGCLDVIKKSNDNQTQLAIAELEKVKNLAVVLLDGFCHSIHYSQKEFRGHRYIEFYDLIRGIDNQIEELKGEKDGNNK